LAEQLNNLYLQSSSDNSNTTEYARFNSATYTVYVKDANNCTDPTPVQVTINENPVVNATETIASHVM
jgi:hypothetical protein